MITATVKTASNFFLREYSASVFSAFTHLFTIDMPLMGNLIILQLTSSPHDWLDVNGMMLEERKRINFFLNFSIQQNSRRFSHYSFTPSFEHQSHRKRSFHLLPELTLPREENRSWLGCYGSRAGPSFSYITTSSSIDPVKSECASLSFNLTVLFVGTEPQHLWGAYALPFSTSTHRHFLIQNSYVLSTY